jgi:hypothetical protein
MQVVLEDIKRTLGAKEVCLPRYPDKKPPSSKDTFSEALPGPHEPHKDATDLQKYFYSEALPELHKPYQVDLEQHKDTISAALPEEQESQKTDMGPEQGHKGREYRWICCECGGDNSYSHDAGCASCSFHWRQACCIIYGVKLRKQH